MKIEGDIVLGNADEGKRYQIRVSNPGLGKARPEWR
jgi:hypothetical protein